MIKINTILVIIVALATSGCATSVPDEVSRLSELQIPVVPPVFENENSEPVKQRHLYSENAFIINTLQSKLKSTYLHGAQKRDIFDNNSMSHHVYIALANLEQGELINEQYLSEGNTRGLAQLHDALQPFAAGNR